ncbi:MAG: hypothetical protein LBN93_08690 [Candidatus Symbiothrix sp.]|jgi:hypothetical protein|nr:hypothetical protein [Candidatus Symbiothrix sp.]
MKKKLIAFALVAFIAGAANPAFAQEKQEKQKQERTQNNQERFAKFKTDRIDYLAKKMGLTDDEKAKFRPIEEELQQKKFDLYKGLREESQKLKGKELSEADHQKLINLRTENKKREAELDAEYTTKMLDVLPAAKVSKYAMAEQSFGKHFTKGDKNSDKGAIKKAGDDVRKAGEQVRKDGERVRKEGAKVRVEGEKVRKEGEKLRKEAAKAVKEDKK